MSFTVRVPAPCAAEASWTASVIFDEFLGLPFRVALAESSVISIESDGRSLRLPATFFSKAADHWLDLSSIPRGPFAMWNVAQDLRGLAHGKPLPVLSGEAGFQNEGASGCTLLLDVFGTAFFLLSRYEEYVSADRDQHGRFPSGASVLGQQSLLARPLVDEYVEVLWHAMKCVWPSVPMKARVPRNIVSCDVDHPYSAYTRSALLAARKALGDVGKRRAPAEAMRTLGNFAATRFGVFAWDPYDSFEWIMNVNEAAGNRVTFFFFGGGTHRTFDPLYDPNETRVRRLLKRIDERGHEIGLHGSYRSAEGALTLQSELSRLRKIVAEESIAQPISGSRQHYLRWLPGVTEQLVAAAGLRYDSTLGFADRPGFRCGTSRDYTMYDVVRRVPLALRQRPLVLMEDSVMDSQYLGLGATQAALDVMMQLKTATREVGADFTVLWHNSSLRNDEERSIYRCLVS